MHTRTPRLCILSSPFRTDPAYVPASPPPVLLAPSPKTAAAPSPAASPLRPRPSCVYRVCETLCTAIHFVWSSLVRDYATTDPCPRLSCMQTLKDGATLINTALCANRKARVQYTGLVYNLRRPVLLRDLTWLDYNTTGALNWPKHSRANDPDQILPGTPYARQNYTLGTLMPAARETLYIIGLLSFLLLL